MGLVKDFLTRDLLLWSASAWLPCGGVSLENELRGYFDLGEQQDPRPSTEPK